MPPLISLPTVNETTSSDSSNGTVVQNEHLQPSPPAMDKIRKDYHDLLEALAVKEKGASTYQRILQLYASCVRHRKYIDQQILGIIGVDESSSEASPESTHAALPSAALDRLGVLRRRKEGLKEALVRYSCHFKGTFHLGLVLAKKSATNLPRAYTVFRLLLKDIKSSCGALDVQPEGCRELVDHCTIILASFSAATADHQWPPTTGDRYYYWEMALRNIHVETWRLQDKPADIKDRAIKQANHCIRSFLRWDSKHSNFRFGATAHLIDKDPTEFMKRTNVLHEAPDTITNTMSHLRQELNFSLPAKADHIRDKLWDLFLSTGLFPETPDLTEEIGDIGRPIMWGGCADIRRGYFLKNKMAVAVKTPRVNLGAQKRLMREISHWKKLKHEHVLPLLGTITHDGNLAMVSPFMENGHVLQYLIKYPKAERGTLGFDITLGLQYLHSRNVVHGDLKAPNVLVTPTGVAVLTDFGLSRTLDPTPGLTESIRSRAVGTAPWMAYELHLPEDDNEAPKCTKASDIWALACTILQLFTEDIPFGKVINNSPGKFFHKLQTDIHPDRPDQKATVLGLDDKLWEILLLCWDKSPKTRPSIDEVASMIFARAQKLTAPALLWDNQNRFVVPPFLISPRP